MTIRALFLGLVLLSLIPPPVFASQGNEQTAVIIDYTHAGTPTDTSCGDSSAYVLTTFGGLALKWPGNMFLIQYMIDSSGVINDVDADGSVTSDDQLAAEQAVVNAFNTWDAEEHPAGMIFQRVPLSSNKFPFSPPALPPNIHPYFARNPVLVQWVGIDGPGFILALTFVIFFVASGDIAGALILFDNAETWGVLSGDICFGAGSENSFDIENVAAHEIGHVLGLDHPPAVFPDNIPLTMFAFATRGETYKRTLATGDKLGLAALYP